MCGPESNHGHHATESSLHQSQADASYRKPRTLVLCFDGTNDVFDDTSTNIIRLFAALEKGKPSEQIVYYQPGIGTYVRPEAPWAPVLRDAAMIIDKGFAWYIGTHIIGGYKFLMQHYTEGDRICLFGFSRGAFTARCLAGMLHKVGLLPRSNTEHVDFAYTLYKSRNNDDIRRAREFKTTFSVHVEVEFVGVWDTVASVGIGAPLLPFNDSETFVRTFRHALAIDEHRAKFQPNPWKYRKECACGSQGRTQEDGFSTIEELTRSLHAACEGTKGSLCWCRDDKDYHGGKLTDVKEVWFPGFHADVGGGNDKNSVRNTLANPSLRWMVTEILKANSGVIFKKDAFEERLPTLAAKVKAFQSVQRPSSSYLDVNSYHHGHASEATTVNGSVMTPPLTPGSSEMKKTHGETMGAGQHHHVDEPRPEEEANGVPHDMLWKKPLWWILEFLPLEKSWLKKNGEPVTGFRWNLGRYRSIDHTIPYFHDSVRLRKESSTSASYNPLERCRHPENMKWVHEDEELPENVKAALAGGSHC